MHFDCNPVEPSFFDTAPMRFRHEVDLDATSPAPHGVGSTRTVTLATATIFEHFYCWEPDRRCSFYLTGTEPRLPVAAGGPLSRMYFDGTFKSACEHLQTYVRND